MKMLFGSSLPPVVGGRCMSCLRYLCFLAYCVVFLFSLCSFCVHYLVCVRPVYAILPVSLDCLSLIAPSVFLTFIYLQQ